MMRQYIGILHKDLGSDYGVSFPDFPGCVTAGSSLDEARTFAEEALSFHIEGMIEDGEAIPEPSSLATVTADPENRGGVPILVAVGTGEPGTVHVDVMLPEKIVAEIDRRAERHGLSRSGFLARAARRAIESDAG